MKNCEKPIILKKYKKCFSQLFHDNGLAKSQVGTPNGCHWWIVKVKNYNLNVTEVRDSDLKNAFPVILNFTVGIVVDLDRFLKNFGR